MRKPRSDSKLLNLPEEQQAKLAGWMMDGQPYPAILQMLESEFGVKSSGAALSAFWQDVVSAQALVRRQNAVAMSDQLGEALKRSSIANDVISDAIKQAAFTILINPQAKPADVMSLASQFLKLRDQEIKADQLNLAREKHAVVTGELFLKWQADKKMQAIAESTTLTRAEKIAALRERYLADVDALEQSGTVQIPA